MAASGPTNVTELLNAARTGDGAAAGELLPLVYGELRRLAARQMGRLPGGGRQDTLQPTALVHEAYLRLVGGADVPWPDRRHFFAAAATTMREVLVERARRKYRVKHGGGRRPVGLGAVADLADQERREPIDILALDEALTHLTAAHPRQAEIVMLRYFAGLSVEDIARAMELSPATVKREWTLAKVALFEEMAGD